MNIAELCSTPSEAKVTGNIRILGYSASCYKFNGTLERKNVSACHARNPHLPWQRGAQAG